MKRSDLTTRLILGAVQAHGVNAWDVLSTQFPPKLVLAAMGREVRRDNLDYGVWLGRPWLTDKGRAQLANGEHTYEPGGLLPHAAAAAVNTSGRPERVLSPAEFAELANGDECDGADRPTDRPDDDGGHDT